MLLQSTSRVQEVLNRILEQFKTGDIPALVSTAMFPVPNSPSQKWSMSNRVAMFSAQTADARTFNQWKEVDRSVRKGCKAVYIFAPNTKLIEKENDDGEVEQKAIIKGFRAIPVFKFEDTEGEPLVDQPIENLELPLLDRAREWGLKVELAPGNGLYHGYYSPKRGEIRLASPEERVFFHELAHAAHHRVNDQIKNSQDPLQEIVAELSAAALSRMVGIQENDTLGNSYQYIEQHAAKLTLPPLQACIRVLNEVEKVLVLVINGADRASEENPFMRSVD